jgi:hypothetical protein
VTLAQIAGALRDPRLLWALPALLAGAYLIVVLARFNAVITTINEDSDVVVAPVMAKLLGQVHGPSTTVLGNHPYYEEFLFLRATAGLPFYRQLWEITPLLWSLLGVGVFAWATARAFGRTEAALAATVLICLGALGRLMFYSFDWHGLTVLHTIVVCAVLMWLAHRAETIRWRSLLAGALLLGLFNAITVASDRLFAFWALAPLVLVSALMAGRRADAPDPARIRDNHVTGGLRGRSSHQLVPAPPRARRQSLRDHLRARGQHHQQRRAPPGGVHEPRRGLLLRPATHDTRALRSRHRSAVAAYSPARAQRGP